MTAHETRPGHVCQPCAELAARIAGWAAVGAEAGRDGLGGAGQGSDAPTGLETAEEAAHD